jgi:uncharacterized RDD family membrane protein YckC
MNNHAGSRQLYARAAPRLQAYLRDFLVYIAILVACILAAVAVGTPIATQVSVIICIALWGDTIGHLSLGLRIVRCSDLGPVSFGRALVRTAVKGLFGLWVFMAIYFTRRSQGLHDLVAGTVVIPRNPAMIRSYGFTAEKLLRKNVET